MINSALVACQGVPQLRRHIRLLSALTSIRERHALLFLASPAAMHAFHHFSRASISSVHNSCTLPHTNHFTLGIRPCRVRDLGECETDTGLDNCPGDTDIYYIAYRFYPPELDLVVIIIFGLLGGGDVLAGGEGAEESLRKGVEETLRVRRRRRVLRLLRCL